MVQRGLLPMAHTWPLVGRDQELEMIGAALDDPDCHTVGLIGAAGTGKTRLARAAGELATSRGITAVTIRATATASELPFAALTPLFLELDVDPKSGEWPLHAIAKAVEDRGPHGRLALVIDDAPELDKSSRAVVDQLAGMAGIFLVFTVRDGPDEPAPDLDLWKHDQVRRMQIGELAANELAALVQIALNGPVDGATLRSLTDACEGNLLLLRELILGALESGALTTRHGIWRHDGSLVDSQRLSGVINRRLQGVPAPGRETLELISLGEPLDLRLVAEMAPLETIESLETAGLIESVQEDGRVDIRFSHPLYAEVLRSQLSPVRRTRLYASLADAAERAGTLGPEQTLRVAVWRLEGGGGDPALSVSAGRVAFDLEDFELAARLARVAWDASGAVDAAILLADSLDRLGWSEEVEHVMRVAYPKAATDQEITALVVRRSSTLYRWPQRTQEADALLVEAAARVTDPTCRRTIEAQRGALVLRSGDVTGAIAMEQPLLDDQRDEAFVLASLNLGAALSLGGRSEAAIAHLDDFASTMRPLGVDFPLWTGTVPVAWVHSRLENGRLAEALEMAQSAYRIALERDDHDGRAWMACMIGLALVSQGQLHAAEPALREASALFEEMDHPGERWGLACVAMVAGQAGRAPAAAAAVVALEAVAPSGWGMMDVYEGRGRAWAAVAAGEMSGASTILWDLVEAGRRTGQRATEAVALHDLVRIGEDRRAAGQLDELAARVEGALMASRASYARAILGEDPALAEQAADQFEACGALLYAAEAAALEGKLSVERGLHRRAAAAGRRASRLGARCQGARTPPLRSSGDDAPLSAREREIALMAAEGLSNRAIADKLVLSKRTVENHLQRAYTKCGVTGRDELAAALGVRPGGIIGAVGQGVVRDIR